MKKTQIISLKVIALFTIAILSSFVGDLLSLFLGDFPCGVIGRCHDGYSISYTEHIHWGFRHWIYFTMCVVLFCLQANYIFSDKPEKLK
jgi:hypothetical protein